MNNNCKYCGNAFESVRPWQKYCSNKCRFKEWDKNNPRVRVKEGSYEHTLATLKELGVKNSSKLDTIKETYSCGCVKTSSKLCPKHGRI